MTPTPKKAQRLTEVIAFQIAHEGALIAQNIFGKLILDLKEVMYSR